MNIPNLHLGAVDDLDIAALAALPPSDLARLLDLLDESADALKARKDKLATALDRKYGEAAHRMRIAAGKDTGVVHLDDGAFDVAADTGKTVKWNQKLLIAALNSLPPETARHYGKAEFKVEESKYTGAPPDIQKVLAPARSVTPGRTSYTFKLKKKE